MLDDFVTLQFAKNLNLNSNSIKNHSNLNPGCYNDTNYARVGEQAPKNEKFYGRNAQFVCDSFNLKGVSFSFAQLAVNHDANSSPTYRILSYRFL